MGDGLVNPIAKPQRNALGLLHGINRHLVGPISPVYHRGLGSRCGFPLCWPGPMDHYFDPAWDSWVPCSGKSGALTGADSALTRASQSSKPNLISSQTSPGLRNFTEPYVIIWNPAWTSSEYPDRPISSGQLQRFPAILRTSPLRTLQATPIRCGFPWSNNPIHADYSTVHAAQLESEDDGGTRHHHACRSSKTGSWNRIGSYLVNEGPLSLEIIINAL